MNVASCDQLPLQTSNHYNPVRANKDQLLISVLDNLFFFIEIMIKGAIVC